MENIEKAINILKDMGIDIVIHCGDVCKPAILTKFEKNGIFVYLVFGNMDDRRLLTETFRNSEYINVLGESGEFKMGGKNLAFAHHLRTAESLMKGNHDAMFYGHTHKKSEEIIGKTLLVNPGELEGYYGKASFAVYDTENNNAKFIGL
ncbi:MAG: YfcE family phosphodiesterase [Candidatus Aenigmarchaeota archaeon]|nr:YfcE family phosphodiesterase [Candidatus Aenigmarchaeota archaeon]